MAVLGKVRQEATSLLLCEVFRGYQACDRMASQTPNRTTSQRFRSAKLFRVMGTFNSFLFARMYSQYFMRRHEYTSSYISIHETSAIVEGMRAEASEMASIYGNAPEDLYGSKKRARKVLRKVNFYSKLGGLQFTLRITQF